MAFASKTTNRKNGGIKMINVKLLALTQFDQFAKGVDLPSEKEMEMIMSFAAIGC